MRGKLGSLMFAVPPQRFCEATTRSIAVLLLMLFVASGCCYADVSCTPVTPVAQQSRTSLKHRTVGFQTASLNPTSVAGMLSWPNPAHVSRANTPIDPREDNAYTLTGDLRRVKIEDNDCDFHLEITSPGGSKNDDRVIVEIPQGPKFTSIRELLIQALLDAGEKDLRTTARIDLKHSLSVTVSGYAFFDAFHFSGSDPKRGHSHGTAMVGTLWELHPVWALTVGGGPAAPTFITSSTAPSTSEPEGGAYDFSIARTFLQQLESGHTILFKTTLRLGEHSGIHPLASDCEAHVAGFPQDNVGWPAPFIVEPPNLCHFDSSGAESADTSGWLTTFDRLKDKTCDVTGFPRIFTENATSGGGPSNPNHVFEINPAISIN